MDAPLVASKLCRLILVMPDRCCVPKCSSNYDKQKTYVSVFKFPKNVAEKELWCKKIPRKNWSPSDRSVVCAKHFRDCDIVRFDEFTNRKGEKIQLPRKNPKLKKNACPSIFENCSKYLSEKELNPGPSEAEKLEKLNDMTVETFLENDKIKDFDNLSENEEENISSFRSYGNPVIVKNINDVLIINVDLNSAPIIQVPTFTYRYSTLMI